MAPSRPLRVALIGQGFMGRAHSNAWRQVKHFFPVPFDIDCRVICGRNRHGLEAMAATWGWGGISTDWRETVGRADIDAVDIAVPNALHAEIAIAAAGAGKMVLCEKPMALTAAEARRMTEAARGVPTAVWYNYRRVPAVAFARRLIDEGRLGEIFHYRATYLQQSGNDPRRAGTWKFDRGQAGSGALGDLMSHVVDLALYLNGPLASLVAMQHTFAAGREVDDATLLLARFANGSLGSFEATRYAVGCRNRNRFEIHGSRGMLRFDLEDLNRLEFLDATGPAREQGARNLLVTGPDHPYSDQFWKPGHIIGYEHTFIAALGDFLEAAGRGDRFRPDFEDGAGVQRILDAISESHHVGNWVTIR